jgi:TfoX/Sxy family transcriptional regulator of competence genes
MPAPTAIWIDGSSSGSLVRTMAYDEELAARIRRLIEGEPAMSEKRMFGGLGFMVGGNLAVAASAQGGLLVRVDPDESAALVADGGASYMEMRGRPAPGWLRVPAAAVARDRDLSAWVDRGVRYARSLPAK